MKNKIIQGINEYLQKYELVREIKQIIEELDTPKICLDMENSEALELFENHEQCWMDY